MARDDKPPVFDQFDAKLKNLRSAQPPPRDESDDRPKGRARLGDGFQVGVELVAGMIGGLLIGWALDSWVGTKPLFLVIFLFLGFAAGMLNVYRTLKHMGKAGLGRGRPDSDT